MTTPTRLLLDGVEYEKDTAGDGLYWTRDGALIAGNVGWAFDHIVQLRAFAEDVVRTDHNRGLTAQAHGIAEADGGKAAGYRFIWEERGETNG